MSIPNISFKNIPFVGVQEVRFSTRIAQMRYQPVQTVSEDDHLKTRNHHCVPVGRLGRLWALTKPKMSVGWSSLSIWRCGGVVDRERITVAFDAAVGGVAALAFGVLISPEWLALLERCERV